MAHRTPINVRFNELDPYGHVNHAVYATYCELGRIDALEALDVDLPKLASDGYQLVVTGLTMKFLAPALASDHLVVETWLPVLRRASGTWHQRVIRAESADVLLTAEVAACVTDNTGRPTKPPADLFASFEALRPPPAGADE